MEKVDYSKLGKKTLEESGIFSNASIEVREIIFALRITKIADFLKLIDENAFVGYKYKETLMEAQGLARLLKQEYFNIPIDENINFATPIKYMFFEPVSVWLYGVKTNDHKQINIYSLITSLGFNADERSKILNVEESSLEDTFLIDLLYNAYVKIIKYGDNSKNEQILTKKLLIILKYYLVHYRDDRVSNFMKDFYLGIEEFNDLLIKKNASNVGDGVIKR